MRAQYSFVIFLHLSMSSLLKRYCHIKGSSMATMHAKSTSPDGVPIIFEIFLIGILGVTTSDTFPRMAMQKLIGPWKVDLMDWLVY